MRKLLIFAVAMVLVAFVAITFINRQQKEVTVNPGPIAPVMEQVKALKKTCHIAGDSIAFGTHQVLGGCTWDAKVGIPSGDIINRVKPADFLVISSGTNDYSNPKLKANLLAARSKATGKVIWILSQKTRARTLELEVAKQYGDMTVSFVAGRDHIHPKSYNTLAKAVLEKMK